MKQPTLEELLKAGVHFGHKASKWHPRMEPFIFAVRQGIHILDLEKTATALAKASEFLKSVAKDKGIVLFLGTKKQAQPIVKKLAEELGMPYVTHRWLGGTLTNFSEIKSRVNRLKEIESMEQAPDYEDKYTKKERLEFSRDRERLELLVGGIREMQSLPQALVVLDIRAEKTAISEARRKKIPIVALADTNTNPDLVTHPIPGNDDAIKSLELIASVLKEAVKEGQEAAKKKDDEKDKGDAKDKGEKEKPNKNSK